LTEQEDQLNQLERRLIRAWLDKVRTFGDFAVVTGRTSAAGIHHGSSFSVTLRFTDVFVKRGADWQAAASQGTLITQ
jgi:ketosteroid isomerase-like protein